MANVFNVQIFFVVFREALEAVIIVSVLLAFLKQGLGGSADDPVVYKKLVRQVWVGAILGVVVCLIIGAGMIGAFYALKKDLFAKYEDLWEAIFSLIASILITIMGLAMLRINKMKEKWRVKLAQALVKKPENGKKLSGFGHFTKKYAMAILPFITTLREGLEAVVFVGGVGLSAPASSFPLAVVAGLAAGILIGVIMYYTGSSVSLQIFLVASTCFLYLIGAGLFSKCVWFFGNYIYNRQTGGDASENGSGPGTYDISKSVWHVNCCNPQTDSGWGIFNALLGWQNSATYGSVISYNVYWIAIIIAVYCMWYEERNGHLPFLKNVTMAQLKPSYYFKKKQQPLTKKEQEELFAQVRAQKIGEDDVSVEGKNTEKVTVSQ
ncbi:hypothetical protein PUMCH_004660 [Australozyma saopauloensis]|uniref:Plasma membrane iron permease n=1 Tax=Australozyma saopauloensis TaxID=291208 RepID=A0AAX4HFN8_9ASCO|nr:hypothetical protein PUMCH_004660 [[Candida] saopauloensis]